MDEQNIMDREMENVFAEMVPGMEMTSEIRQELEAVWNPYFQKERAGLTEEVLEKICLILHTSSYKHKPAEEKRQLKEKAKKNITEVGLLSQHSVFPSQQKVLLVQLRKHLNKTKECLEKLQEGASSPGRETLPPRADPAWVAVMARKVLHDAVEQKAMERNGKCDYPADILINEFMRDLIAMIEGTDTAVKNLEKEIKPAGKGKNVFAQSLVMPLANAFYDLTGEIPECGYSGSEKVAKGKVMEFIQSVFTAFSISKSDNWIVQNFNKQLNEPSNQIIYTPKWLINQG